MRILGRANDIGDCITRLEEYLVSISTVFRVVNMRHSKEKAREEAELIGRHHIM